MMYHRTKFHIPSSNASLVKTIKRKAEYNLRATAMLLFYKMADTSKIPMDAMFILLTPFN
jgi:hypothetical protein